MNGNKKMRDDRANPQNIESNVKNYGEIPNSKGIFINDVQHL